MHKGKSCEVKFFGGQIEDYNLGTVSQEALRNCSEEVRGGGSAYMWFGKRRGRGDMCKQAHILAEGYCWSQEGWCLSRGADFSINYFSAFLVVSRCKNSAHKIF